MTREMYVSSTPHETKVALVEDDQLAEIFYERENEYTLAGSIYKGRVTRVLPGMQSAFVDIGLERDAFLYVSDFLELPDDEESEFGEIAVTRPETFVSNRPPQEPRFELKREPVAEPAVTEEREEFEPSEEVAEGNTQEFTEGEAGGENRGEEGDRFRGNRRRRRGRRGRGFPDNKFARPGREEGREEQEEAPSEEREAPREERPAPRREFGPPPGYQPIILPGESLSKYRTREAPAEVEEKPAPEKSNQQPTFVIESEDSDFEPPAPQPETEAAESIADAAQPAAQTPAAVPEGRQAERTSFQPRGPIVLPGESIAKYQRREQPAALEMQAVQAPEGPAEVASPERTEESPTPEAEPATSAATEPETSRKEPGERAPFEHRPSSERKQQDYQPSSASFSVLPGESIAKYRRRAPAQTDQLAREQAKHAAESEERHSQQAATFVIESEPWAETLAKDVAPAAESPLSVEPAEASHETESQEPQRATEAADSESPAPEQRDEERLEQMNVAAIFGGDEVAHETDAAPGETGKADASHAHADDAGSSAVDMPVAESESPEELEPAAPGAPAVEEAVGEVQVSGGAHARDEHVFGRAREGDTLEHEEIEGEEEESHFHAGTEDDPDADFIELEEEETLESDHFARVVAEAAMKMRTPEEDELTAPVEEHDEENVALAPAYEEEEGEVDEDADTEFEEEELVGEDETLPEEQQEAAIGRAEVGAPGGGAAGFQRRQERPFDRRDRGRRGGRGPRGGRPMRRHEAPRQQVQISDLLKEGQEVLIQIAKEPIGKKGARITSHIALPGRFLVYMPTVNHVGVSRKITSDEERQRLKRIMISEREGGHGGFIVRTAAAGIGEDELRADIRFLKNLWAQIKQRAENSKPPALIYHDLNLVERILRDQVTSDFSQIWVDNEGEYERILNFANRFQPSLVRRVKLYTRETPLFEQFGVQEEINKALKAKVWLKSGGYIVINQTEALVAIDINTGKYVGKTARLEDTIVKTNIDAIREIVRQIRLRDLGGIIVIDFIDMDERKNRQKVMQALEEALKADRSPSKVLAFNDFGLVAITRKRVKQSLERTLGSSCPYCTGNGYVKSVTTVCNEIYVEMRKMARHLDSDIVNLRVNPEIAKALKAEKGKWLTDFEEVTGRTVLVKADAMLHQEQFDIHG